MFGFVLVEHCFRGGVALGAEFGAVVAAPLIGGSAALVEVVEMRHHVAGVELVGPLGRLKVGPVVRLLQKGAERPLLLIEPFDERDRSSGVPQTP